eukprot:201116_1
MASVLVLILNVVSIYATNSAFTIGTWNSFDVYYGGSRDARRDYFFRNKQKLFGDLDIFCTQESHTYSSIADFTNNFKDIFPYSYYNDNPSSSYQACLQSEISDFEVPTSEIYACNEACTDSFPSTLGYAFCLWRCFGELRDINTGITTRANNPPLFDFGKTLELSSCLICLWKSKYVETDMSSSWITDNVTPDVMFDDILDVCTSKTNTFDYKANQGVILWSKYKFDTVEFIELYDAVFTPRGYIIATISDANIIGNNPLTVICTHLETPTINGVFGGKFTTMRQENIDNKVTEMSNITQLEVNQLINKINNINGDVILLGDLNIGINSRVDIYNKLLSQSGLSNVFGTNKELSDNVNCSRCNTNMFTTNQEIVDHILIKGDIYVDSATRFLDELYNTSDGLIPLSDHYGIKATLFIVEPMISTIDSDNESMANDIHSAIAFVLVGLLAFCI